MPFTCTTTTPRTTHATRLLWNSYVGLLKPLYCKLFVARDLMLKLHSSLCYTTHTPLQHSLHSGLQAPQALTSSMIVVTSHRSSLLWLRSWQASSACHFCYTQPACHWCLTAFSPQRTITSGCAPFNAWITRQLACLLCWCSAPLAVFYSKGIHGGQGGELVHLIHMSRRHSGFGGIIWALATFG